jgi:hypothetical protein
MSIWDTRPSDDALVVRGGQMNLSDVLKSALDCQKAKGRPGLSVWSRDDASLDELTEAGTIPNPKVRATTVRRIVEDGLEIEETGSPHCTIWLSDTSESTLMNVVNLFDEPVANPNPRPIPKRLRVLAPASRQLWCDFNERDDEGYVITDVAWAEDGFDARATESVTVGDDEGNRCIAVIHDQAPDGLIRLEVDWDSFVPVG